jgi:hypothetical protein
MKRSIEMPDTTARQAKDRAEKLFAAIDRSSGITAAKRLTRAKANARVSHGTSRRTVLSKDRIFQ